MATHIVNTHEAKSRLSGLLREVEAGGDVIVARNGRPVAKLIPWPPPRLERRFGTWAGRIQIHGDIVESDAEIVALFDESAESPL